MVIKTGQCMCGAVTFTVQDTVTEFGTCHCDMCQRWSGSSLMAFSAPKGTVDYKGTENIATIQSSEWAERAWCNKCGSGLWVMATGDGKFAGSRQIPIGLLDDTDDMTLIRELFVDNKSKAFSYTGDLQQMTGAEVMAFFAQLGEEN